MFRHKYHLSLLLSLALLLPATLSAKKKVKEEALTPILSLDEQHYFDSLYFKAIALDQCHQSDSALTLMKAAVVYYDSILHANDYIVKVNLPTEAKLDLPKGLKSPAPQQVPGLAAAQYFLSNRYRQQNNAMFSLIAIETAVAIDSVNYWYTEAEGNLFLALKRLDDARISYERLVRNYPEKSDPLYSMAEIYLRLDSIDQCLKTLDRLEELDGVSPQLTQYKFAILQENGRSEEGFDQYRKLIARYPYNVQYRIRLGDLQMQNAQIQQAKQTYDEAAAIEPDNAYVWVALANYYSMTGDQPAADSLVASALTNANLDLKTKVDVMGEYLKGSFRKVSQYRELSEQGKAFAKLDTLAIYRTVDSLFTEVATMHPTADEVYELQAEWRDAMGQDSLAAESMRFAVDLKPTSQEYWEKLLYYSTSWMSKADVIRLTQEALEQFPACQTAYMVAAWAYVQQKQYDEAIGQYERAIESMTPPDANRVSTLWGSIGDLYQETGQKDKAYECYELSIKYNPSNYSVLNNYAYYLSTELKELSKAERMALQVIQKYPDNATYLDTYAWILHLEGSEVLAIFYQQHAIECMAKEGKQSSTLLDHYGDMLLKNNDLKGAVEQWQKALECEDCSDPEAIRKKIESAETLLDITGKVK